MTKEYYIKWYHVYNIQYFLKLNVIYDLKYTYINLNLKIDKIKNNCIIWTYYPIKHGLINKKKKEN